MWPYWLMFVWPLLGVLSHRRLVRPEQRLLWWFTAAFFTVMIGLRYEVGGDWYHYADSMYAVASSGLSNALQFGDPGYYAMSWLVAQLGGGIYVVNLLAARW